MKATQVVVVHKTLLSFWLLNVFPVWSVLRGNNCCKAAEQRKRRGLWPRVEHGGVWLRTLQPRRSPREPAGGLPQNRGGHSASACARLTPGTRTRCPTDLARPQARNRCPEIQRHTHPSRSRLRKVSYWNSLRQQASTGFRFHETEHVNEHHTAGSFYIPTNTHLLDLKPALTLTPLPWVTVSGLRGEQLWCEQPQWGSACHFLSGAIFKCDPLPPCARLPTQLSNQQRG